MALSIEEDPVSVKPAQHYANLIDEVRTLRLRLANAEARLGMKMQSEMRVRHVKSGQMATVAPIHQKVSVIVDNVPNRIIDWNIDNLEILTEEEPANKEAEPIES